MKNIIFKILLILSLLIFMGCGTDSEVLSIEKNEVSEKIEKMDDDHEHDEDEDHEHDEDEDHEHDESAESKEEAQSIAEIAVAGGFNTLVAALDAADLVETLSGDGTFTVFAPTDEAFAALPEGVLEGLLADTEALTQVLLYHVVGDVVKAETVVTLDAADTLQGSKVAIEVVDGNVFVNESQVTSTDIEASNGVIHVIDKVLVPELDGAKSREGNINDQIPNFVVFQYENSETDYTYRRLVIRDIIDSVLEKSDQKSLISQQIPVGIFESSQVQVSSINSLSFIEDQIPQVF